jgi:outer membrane protein
MILRTLVVGLLLAGAALAEPQFPTVNSTAPLSLDSLVSLGFQNNPGLRQTEMNTRLNHIGEMNAVGNFLPSVSVGGSWGQTYYRTPTFQNPNGSISSYPVTQREQVFYLDEAGLVHGDSFRTVTLDVPSGSSRSSQLFLSLDESIFEGGRRYFLYKQAIIQKDINNLNVVNGRKTLAANIAEQVMVVLTDEKVLDLNKKLRDQKQDAYDLAKARFDVGSVTELDVIQAQITLNSAENEISTAERALESDKEALNQVLGIDLKSRFPIAEAEGVTPYQFKIEDLVAEAYSNRTDLRIADLTVKRQTYALNTNLANYLPNVSFGAQFTRSQQSGKSAAWTLSPKNDNERYSLNMNWNIFDGFTREYNMATQRVARDQSAEATRQLRLSLERDVRNAYYNLENIFNQLTVTGNNRDLAEKQLNLERERYRLGAASQLDLRDSQVTYAQAETDNLQKMLQYNSSLIALELAVGKSLR